MEFTIDTTSPAHGYLQLADQLREKIRAGEIADRLPSLTELEARSGVSKSTVQHAIRLLVEEGVVFTVKGRGIFVKRDAG